MQKTREEIIYTEKRGTYHLINKSAFIFQKLSRDYVRQWCKTNGTIMIYNWLKRERRKEKRMEEWEEEEEREKRKNGKKDKRWRREKKKFFTLDFFCFSIFLHICNI